MKYQKIANLLDRASNQPSKFKTKNWPANNANRKVMFKNCAPFTICVSEIDNIQVDNAKDIDIVMPIYNLIGYNNNYSKTSGSLKNIPSVNNDNTIVDFTNANLTDSFNFKAKMTG